MQRGGGMDGWKGEALGEGRREAAAASDGTIFGERAASGRPIKAIHGECDT